MAEKPAIPADIDVDAALDAFLAKDREAADAAKSFAESANQGQLKRLSKLLKKRDGEESLSEAQIRDFLRAFKVARRTSHDVYPSLAHQWVFEHTRSESLREPAVARTILADAALVRAIPSKYRLGLVENLVASDGFVPTHHWMVVGARACKLLPGHVAIQLLTLEKMSNVVTANAVITCKPLLKRLPAQQRMELTRMAFMVCNLPAGWGDSARNIGFTDAEIAELVTARCRFILGKMYAFEQLSPEDIDFLRVLRQPATSGGISYREVLDDRQLAVVVKAVRRGIPARTPEEHEATRRLCLGTNARRFRH